MGNPAGGVLVLLLALFLLLSYFSGSLEWLFRLADAAKIAKGEAIPPAGAAGPPNLGYVANPGTMPTASPRPTSSGTPYRNS